MKITKLYSFILVLLTVHFSLYATETGTPFSGKEEEDVTQTSVVKKVSFKEQLAEYKTIEESEESSDSDSEPTSEEQIPLVELKQSEFPIHESFNRIISSIGFKNFAKLLEFAFAPKKNIDLNELPKDLMVHHIVAYVKNYDDIKKYIMWNVKLPLHIIRSPQPISDIWNLRNHANRKTIVSPDSKLIALIFENYPWTPWNKRSAAYTIEIRAIETGKLKRRMYIDDLPSPRHTTILNDLIFSPDSNNILCLCQEAQTGYLKIFNITNAKRDMPYLKIPISESIACDASGKYLLSRIQNNVIEVDQWDGTLKKILRMPFTGQLSHRYKSNHTMLSPRGTYLLFKDIAFLIDLSLQQGWQIAKEPCTHASFDADDTYLTINVNKALIANYKLEVGKQPKAISSGQKSHTLSCTNNQLLANAPRYYMPEPRQIDICPMHGGQCIHQINRANKGVSSDITLSTDGKYLVHTPNDKENTEVYSNIEWLDSTKLDTLMFDKKLTSSQIILIQALIFQLARAAQQNKSFTLSAQDKMLFSKLPAKVQEIFKDVVWYPYQLSWVERYIYPKLARLLPTPEE